jgi:hypothetical protein
MKNDQWGDISMPQFAGSASSKVQSQTTIGVPGHDNRQLTMAILAGVHTSSDQKFDKANVTYAGTAELANGNGDQRGYFYNVHPNGDTSQGTFEAKVTMTEAGANLDGTWTFTGGTGGLSGLRGRGVFRSEMTSPTASEMTWSGNYELG